MIPFAEREAQASFIHAQGLRRVAAIRAPEGQRFAVGERVRIADNLGATMDHFPKGKTATVCYTYAHAYGGNDVKSYCLDVDGIGRVSWYYEEQLSAAD